MSAIGRVFIVLNLVLAGVFVGFAGTYLHHSTHWKSEHDTLLTKYQTEKKDLEDRLAREVANANEHQRTSSNLDTLLKQRDSKITELQAENERLDKLLADVQSEIKQINSSHATVATNLQSATEESARAYKMAMEASTRENEAKTKMETAQQELADANMKIKDLENRFAEQAGQLAKVSDEYEQTKAVLGAMQLRFPGAIEMLQPDIRGRVAKVSDDKLITLEITEKAADVKPGYKVAIHDGSRYKGEAVITDVLDGNMAFGTVTTLANGASIRIGDQVATNLSR